MKFPKISILIHSSGMCAHVLILNVNFLEFISTNVCGCFYPSIPSVCVCGRQFPLGCNFPYYPHPIHTHTHEISPTTLLEGKLFEKKSRSDPGPPTSAKPAQFPVLQVSNTTSKTTWRGWEFYIIIDTHTHTETGEIFLLSLSLCILFNTVFIRIQDLGKSDKSLFTVCRTKIHTHI